MGFLTSLTLERNVSEMTDMISAVILLSFGGAMAMIVSGFYVLMHRNRDSPFRSEDYASYAPRASRPNYHPRDVFKREGDKFRKQSSNKRALVVVVLLLVLLVSVAIAGVFFEPLDLLIFLILLSPFLFRLLRMQRQKRDEEGKQDSDRRFFS